MANTLSKTGIQDNNTIRTWHVTQSIDAFTKEKAYDITLSGSLTIDGNLNLKTNPTGNLQGYAAYSPSSSAAFFSISASTSYAAEISNDITVIQLHHGMFNPSSSKNYYFAINPIISGSGFELSQASASVGTYSPVNLTIVSASITTTVNGTTGSDAPSSYKIFQQNSLLYTFSNALRHNTTISSSIVAVNQTINNFSPILIQWTTPSWSVVPKQVSHNIVLYCNRGLNSV